MQTKSTSLEFHVATSGNDNASGSAVDPFKTISADCNRSKRGATIIVHGGVYRECVDIPYGGTSSSQRLTICSAQNEQVVISGADVLDNWQHLSGNLWQCEVPDSWFEGTNTLREELGGDWFWHKHQPQHLGELFCDGQPMIECLDRTAIAAGEPWAEADDPACTKFRWCVEFHKDRSQIIAHFNGLDPNQACVELSVREACIYP